MTTLWHRIFWALLLILQIGLIAAQFRYGRAFGRIAIFAVAFQIVCCLPLFGLVLQRRIFRHNLWAGFLGVGVAATLFGLLMAVGRGPGDPSHGQVPGLAAIGLTMHALSMFAVFIYVFGSPGIWLAPRGRADRIRE